MDVSPESGTFHCQTIKGENVYWGHEVLSVMVGALRAGEQQARKWKLGGPRALKRPPVAAYLVSETLLPEGSATSRSSATWWGPFHTPA